MADQPFTESPTRFLVVTLTPEGLAELATQYP